MNNKTQTITQDQLIDLLSKGRGALAIGFSAITEVKAVKKNRITKAPNPYQGIFKFSRVNPFVGTDYSRAVNRQLERESEVADFVAKSPQYDYIGGYLVKYKTTGNICIACQFNSTNKNQTRKPIYLVRGEDTGLKIVSKETVEDFLPVESTPTNQGVENPILWRTFGIKGIHSVSLNGIKYRVRNPLPESIKRIEKKHTYVTGKQAIVESIKRHFASQGMIQPLSNPYENEQAEDDDPDQSWDAHKQ